MKFLNLEHILAQKLLFVYALVDLHIDLFTVFLLENV